MKVCSKCKNLKSKGDFYRDLSKKDGLEGRCKQCAILKASKYNKIHKDEHREIQKRFRESNREKVNLDVKKYATSHRKIIGERRTNREKIDISFKLANCLRSRLTHAIVSGQKAGSAVRDLGCSIEELKKYLESKFQPGMTWDNYSHKGWHIDHIEPLCSFDLTNREQLLKACHYSNLTPLWAKDNHYKIKEDLKKSRNL
jgi:hypothetical protein